MVKFLKENANWIVPGFGGLLFLFISKLLEQASTPEYIFRILMYILFILAVIFVLIKIRAYIKRRAVVSVFFSKCSELSDFLFKGKDIDILLDDKYNCFTLHEYYKKEHSLRYEEFSEIILSLKDFICYNQGALANYSYTVGVLHKNLKTAFNGTATDDTLKDLAKNLYKNALTDMKEQFRIIEDNYITSTFFNGRSQYKPRMVVRALDGDRMVDIYRKNSEYYLKSPARDNSGFDHVQRTGKYFLCNDIPKAAAEDRYKNPRLANERVRKYLEQGRQDKEGWIDCWQLNVKYDGTTRRPSPESCYKSTLIIPMTLLGNEGLSQAFRERFGVPTPPRTEEEIARAIYGFLCFDHQETDFFVEGDDGIDVCAGYIFADILSLYLIDFLNYTFYSDTFKKVLDQVPGLSEDLFAKKLEELKKGGLNVTVTH